MQPFHLGDLTRDIGKQPVRCLKSISYTEKDANESISENNNSLIGSVTKITLFLWDKMIFF